MSKSVLQWWGSSFDSFKGRQGLLLLFATIQTFKRTLMLLLRYFWPLLLLDLCCNIWLAPDIPNAVRTFLGFAAPIEPTAPASGIKLVAYFLAKLLLSFVIVLAVRASLEPKNKQYFLLYLKKFGGYSLIFTLLVAGVYFFPLPWLSLFFFMDAPEGRGSVSRSIGNGLRALWYFFPLAFLFHVIEIISDMSTSLLIRLASLATTLPLLIGSLRFALHLVVWLLLLSVIANWYLTIKQNNYELFFGSSRK